MSSKQTRMRRGRRARNRIRGRGVYRLCVNRTPRHIYAQVISPAGDRTLASASTLDAEIRTQTAGAGKMAAAQLVGKLVAERARSAGVESVAFDRSGFKFHGRVKALADAAREAGLSF